MITQNIEERWREAHDLPGFEVSNTGRVRKADTGKEIPVHGFGAKSYIKLVDGKGRKREKNLWRVVYSLFGHNPVKLAVSTTDPQPVQKETAVTDQTTIIDDFKTGLTDAVEETDSQPEAQWVDVHIEGIVAGYRLSNLGEVMSPAGNLLEGTVFISKDGTQNHRDVVLVRTPDSGYKGSLQMRLDGLVARYFLDTKPDPTHEIEHINGDFMDCRAENLRWIPRRPKARRSPPRTPVKRTVRRAARELGKDPHWRVVQTPKVARDRYWVSDQGEVRGSLNKPLGRVVYLNGGVGVNVLSSATGQATTVPVAILVLDAFVGARPTDKHRPQHRNGDRADCRVENLYWGIPGRDEEDPKPTPVPTPSNPTPVPTAVDTDEVEVTILARYSYGGVSILVNDDEILEQPAGTPDNADALSKIWARYAADKK